MGVIEDRLGTSVEPLEAGMAGVDQTVLAMIRLATQGGALPAVRMLAERIVRRTPARDWRGETAAVRAWVARHLRYTRDGLQVETLKTPEHMLEEIRRTGKFLGDCDDASILAAALLLSIGHQPAFLLLGRGNVPHHVAVFDRTVGQVVDPTGEPRGPYSFRRTYDVISPL